MAVDTESVKFTYFLARGVEDLMEESSEARVTVEQVENGTMYWDRRILKWMEISRLSKMTNLWVSVVFTNKN